MGGSWVEALPRALQKIHDLQGESGLSPYQILFGRDRHLAGLPLPPPTKAEDAEAFFQRIREQDNKVADKLNAVQLKRAEAVNKGRKEPPALEVGSKVWYRPEPRPGQDKLDVKWRGPGRVLKRVGEHSYVVEVKEGVHQEAHRSQLRPHVDDAFAGQPIPMYYFSGKAPVFGAAPDEWEVERVRGHRYDRKGNLEFRVEWNELEPEEATWEPFANFVTPNQLVMDYCVDRGLNVDLLGWWKQEGSAKAKGRDES